MWYNDPNFPLSRASQLSPRSSLPLSAESKQADTLILSDILLASIPDCHMFSKKPCIRRRVDDRFDWM